MSRELFSEEVVNGQRYVCVGWIPHINKRDFPTIVIQWASRCADCGASFQTGTTPKQLPGKRRCTEHASPGKRVTNIQQDQAS